MGRPVCTCPYFKQEPCAPYVPHERGMVLSVGRTQGVGLVLGHRVLGIPAGMLKDLIAYHYLFQIGGLRLVLRKVWQWAPYAAALRRG